MPIIIARCRECGHHADGVYVRAQLEGGKKTWCRIEGLAFCKRCRRVMLVSGYEGGHVERFLQLPRGAG